MERLLCTAGCGVPVDLEWAARTGKTAHPRCEIDAAVAAGGGDVKRRGPRGSITEQAVVVDAARTAVASGGSLVGLAMDLRKSEAAVERALYRAGEHDLVSRLKPHGIRAPRDPGAGAGSGGVAPPRTAGSGYVGSGWPRGGRWLAPPSGDGLDAWRAARARRAAFLAAATRPARPVLPVVEELPAGTVMSDALLAELAAREQARARKAAGL